MKSSEEHLSALKRLVLAAAALAFLPRAAAAPPPPDGGFLPAGLSWGMGERDLARLFGPALRRPVRGETGDWVAERVVLEERDFDARLFVAGGGLGRVVLVARPGAASRQGAERLESAIRERLGEPAASHRAGADVDLAWRTSSEDVDLLYSRVEDPDVRWEGLLVVFERGP